MSSWNISIGFIAFPSCFPIWLCCECLHHVSIFGCVVFASYFYIWLFCECLHCTCHQIDNDFLIRRWEVFWHLFSVHWYGSALHSSKKEDYDLMTSSRNHKIFFSPHFRSLPTLATGKNIWQHREILILLKVNRINISMSTLHRHLKSLGLLCRKLGLTCWKGTLCMDTFGQYGMFRMAHVLIVLFVDFRIRS